MKDAVFCCTLDFEMGWGTSSARGNKSSVISPELLHGVVRELLRLLENYNISATWAAVAAIGLTPSIREEIQDLTRSVLAGTAPILQGLAVSENLIDPTLTAPELFDAVIGCTTFQELGCHTFSHLDLSARGVSEDHLRVELLASQIVAKSYGRTMTSLVFPKNQIRYLDIVKECGFRAFRSANSEWYWFGAGERLMARRMLRTAIAPFRLVDELLALAPPVMSPRKVHGLWRIPHSMFFPGRNGVSKCVASKRQVRRAVVGLNAGVTRGGVMTLYTHPHNFLKSPKETIAALEDVFVEVCRLRDKGMLRVLTMEGIADEMDRVT